MIMDIHSHSYYSNCGRDKMWQIIDAACAGGIELFGICDHNYGIKPSRFGEYKAEIARMREFYDGKIKLLTGIEICTMPGLDIEIPEIVTGFDYCLIENISQPESTIYNKVFKYRERLDLKAGIAHTDMVRWAESLGEDLTSFLRTFAENDIFWEMNVNYDSIHGYREHQYVKDFVASEYIQECVRNSGIKISVGFDGHRVEDYLPNRVLEMNKFLDDHGIPKPEFARYK